MVVKKFYDALVPIIVQPLRSQKTASNLELELHIHILLTTAREVRWLAGVVITYYGERASRAAAYLNNREMAGEIGACTHAISDAGPE